MKKYDFSGWATRNNLKCSDGRTIVKDAFKHNDGKIVPLVWNHQHDNPNNVLGHALLENKEDGVYAYCSFNDSEAGENAKRLVEHGDISSLSICANQLKQQGSNVLHGLIREVSLVLAGANPGAFIDSILSHGEVSDDEAIIYTGEDLELNHAGCETSKEDEPDEKKKEKEKGEEMEHSKEVPGTKNNQSEETVSDVFNSLSEKQKNVVYALIAQAIDSDDNDNDDSEGGEKMKHNLFDKEDQKKNENVLTHDDMVTILSDAKRYGSLKDAVIQHGFDADTLTHAVQDANGTNVTYGIANIDYLFPDARTVNTTPDFISRNMDWVNKIVSGAKHLPFSRVKSVHANITMDEARAKGYIKGHQKADEVFALLKRTTGPTTIYKKQKLDRDDVIDITDFDVVAWLKVEMRMMLNEEIARAALVGDGRAAGTDDKISEDCIRPIYKESDVYAVKKPIVFDNSATDNDKAKAFVRHVIKSRKDYKGSGNPTLFTTEDMLTDCLLIEDTTGRIIYDTVDKLKTALRVSDIVTVPVMEGLVREGSGADAGQDFTLLGILVNMADYGFGADKGGAVSMFDDFDIDFNQQKYLIETRCSGALMKPYSALVFESKAAHVAG